MPEGLMNVKEYNVNVPINCMNLDDMGREKILAKLKDFDAKNVFLNFEESVDSGSIYFFEKSIHTKQMEKLSSAAEFFKKEGYGVSAWFWSLMADRKLGFTALCDFDGKAVDDFACPADEKFVAFATETIKDVAKTGVDMMVLNDDLRFGFFSGQPTCLCENHIRKICDIVGEKLTRSQLKEKITTGSENKYRDAYLEVNKESLLNFAKAIRKKVDEVNPSLRIGFCAVMSSWDIDGDAYELAKTLAGNTRPFIRLIGAPYWAVEKSWNNRLQDAIELTRMEAAYFSGQDVELIAEGDVWPRPRTKCPASFLEGYDMALRASKVTDGILKIGIDYTASADYEEGYARFHLRNKPVYKKIQEAFEGKTSVGVRVYEFPEKIRKMQNPNALGEQYKMESLFFSQAARTLSCNGIPTVYEGEGMCGIAFGENARYLPKEALKSGMIIDTAAAAILAERGIDAGVESFGGEVTLINERFTDSGNRVIAFNSTSYELSLKHSAKVLSVGNSASGQVPVSFTYTNDEGERFLVINLNPRKNDTLMRHYARGNQYRQFLGNDFYMTCTGNPDMYVLCSEANGEMAAGVWNFCIDPAMNPVVRLGKEYKKIKFINGNGKLCSNRIELEEIPAYGFCGFVLS